MKSCETCPSYVTDTMEVRGLFGKTLEAPVCARHGFVLSRPGQDDEAIRAVAVTIASSCPDHGSPKPDAFVGPVGEASAPAVALPDPKYAVAKGQDVSTCNSCENLVKSPEVMNRFGFPVPLCRATGRLITKPNLTCRTCDFASPGMPVDELGDVTMLPMYDFDYSLETSVAVKAYVSVDNSVTPQEYPTDLEVSKEDAEDGIRAWREIPDPSGRRPSQYLPIFDLDHFDEDQKAKIPMAGDAEHPELYVDHGNFIYKLTVESFILQETPALIGQPGTGKTELARYFAYLMGVPFTRVNVDPTTDADTLFGTKAYSPERGTYFEAGRWTQAWQSTGVLLTDEPNAGPDDFWFAVRPTMDNSKQLVVDHVLLPRDPYCMPVMAFNPPHDARNRGAKELAMADANRLTGIYVDLPPEPIERKIIADWCGVNNWTPTEAQLDLLMCIAHDIREAADPVDGTFPDFWGIRQQVKVARKMPYYDLEEAYALASLNFYDDDVRELILKIVRTYVD